MKPAPTCLALALLLAACNKAEGKGGGDKDPPVPVQTEAVAPVDAEVVIHTTGTVEARSDVTVVAEAPGKVEKVMFELGDDVKEDQVLVKLDRKIQQLTVQQARAQLDQAQAAIELAELQKGRMQKLLDQGSASKAEMDKVTMEARSAGAALAMAKASLGQAQHALSTTSVKSPIAGKVTLKMVSKGQALAQGSPVAQVTDLGALKVTVGLTEREVADLEEGQLVEVVSAVNEEVRATGRVAAIGLKALGPTRAFPVEIWIEEPDPRLHPGMSVELRIFVTTIEGALLVHVNDVFEAEGNRFVWVVEGGRAARHFVETGRSLDEKVVIESGIAAGDRIVVTGGELLREGTAVRDTAAR
jgi:membrane fusion protein (multidrug efflux system)